MDSLGLQYDADDSFKRIARRHQSLYRQNILGVPCDKYGNILKKQEGERGLNFYEGYRIFDAVKERYPQYKNELYANLLRSEHIPFNVFVPFRDESELFTAVMMQTVGVNAASVKQILIEYAPEPCLKYLNDKTSFDVFCDCKDDKGNAFFLAIEVKYTERSYRIGKKEAEYCSNPNSPYNKWTAKSQLYQGEVLETLKTDQFRQLWRNHLLAHSFASQSNYAYYKSIVLYPSGNKYLSKVISEYKSFLQRRHLESFLEIPFEKFFSTIDENAKSTDAKKWIAYLQRRYISED